MGTEIKNIINKCTTQLQLNQQKFLFALKYNGIEIEVINRLFALN